MNLFNPKHLKGDIFGGINAGIVALPAALGFGTLAGLSPIHGLYCAIFLGLFAAIIGGTKTLISNPTGPMAVVTAGIVNTISGYLFVEHNDHFYLKTSFPSKFDFTAGVDPITIKGIILMDDITSRIGQIFPYLFLVILVAATIQILFGVLKLGKYIHYIPTPVVSGFMSGIGVIIIVSQLPKFLGSSFKGGTIDVLMELPTMMATPDAISILIALATMVIIYFFPKITKAVPSPLVAIVVVTAVTYFLIEDNSYRIPAIPSKLPDPTVQFAVFSNIGTMFSGEKAGLISVVILNGLTIAIIGIIDALLTAVVADSLTKDRHNGDREMIGQGIGNAISAFFGGMMGAGTTPATVLNIKSGGRTRLSGAIHALLLVTILLIAAPIASQIPKAALAGLLITVGISILDFEVFKQLKKIPIQDNIVMILVLLLTASWDLMYAVAAGLILASLIFMKKMADVVEGQSRNTKFDRLVNQLIDSFDSADRFREQVVVKNMSGPMFFGFASRFAESIDEIKDVKAVVLNFGGVTYMDQSGMYTLQEGITSLVDRGINVCLSEMHDGEEKLLAGINVIPNLVDSKHVFSSVEECVMWLNEPGHLDNEFAADDELYIPSAYTPNGDGINDEWQLRNIEQYPNCIVTIYNREKVEIFRSIGYKEMWEGEYNGRILPSDKYAYEIDLYGDGKEVKKGTVSIFR